MEVFLPNFVEGNLFHLPSVSIFARICVQRYKLKLKNTRYIRFFYQILTYNLLKRLDDLFVFLNLKSRTIFTDNAASRHIGSVVYTQVPYFYSILFIPPSHI